MPDHTSPEQEPTPTAAEYLFKNARDLMNRYPEHCFTGAHGSVSVMAAAGKMNWEYLVVGFHPWEKDESGQMAYGELPEQFRIYPVTDSREITYGIEVRAQLRAALHCIDKHGYSDGISGLDEPSARELARTHGAELEGAIPAPLTPETVRLIIDQINRAGHVIPHH